MIEAYKVNECVVQVSAYASFGRMNGIGPTVEKQRRRMDVNTEEPQFTNCTRDFLGTLDYIFYTGETHIPQVVTVPSLSV